MKNPHSTTIKFVIEPFFEPLFPIILAASISSGQSRPWPETCGGLEHFLFFHILGISSPQLTFIFFRGGIPPTCHEILMKSHLNSSICSFAVASIAMFRNGKWSKSAGPQQSGALRRGRGWSSERAAGTVGSAGGWRGDRPTGSDILGLVGSQNLQEMIVVQSPPLTLEYLGGVRLKGKKILRNISPDHMKYTPPTCFLGFQKRWGGPPDATF